MQAAYSLDLKIEALNLLDRHDGDFRLIRDRLQIPLKTLRGWRSSEEELRRRFSDRQYHHFANIKLEMLSDIFETSRETIKKIRSGDLEGSTISQLTYLLNTLLHHSRHLEQSFADYESEAQTETEGRSRIRYVDDDDLSDFPPPADASPENPRPPQANSVPDARAETEGANRIRYVDDDPLPDFPPPADGIPETPRPPQRLTVRERLKLLGIGADPESGPPGADALLWDTGQLSDAVPNRSRSGKRRKKSKRRRHKPKRTAR